METTNANIRGFIAECVEVIRGLPGLTYVPDNPPLHAVVWPMVTVYASDGITTDQPAGLVMTGIDNVTIAVVLPLDNLERTIDFLLPYREQIPKALFTEFTKNNASSHAQKIGIISYTLGPIEWPQGIEMFGFLFTVNDVKIQNEM